MKSYNRKNITDFKTSNHVMEGGWKWKPKLGFRQKKNLVEMEYGT